MIRKVKAEDLENGLLDCLCEFGPTSLTARNRAIFGSRQSNPWVTTLVAERNGRVVGTASFFVESKLLHFGCLAGHIEDVAVLPECQGAGVGRALIEAVKGHLREAGCYKAVLMCDNDKVGFYEKCGFELTGSAMRAEICLSGNQ